MKKALALGGGAAGWRTIAIIYAIIGLLVNTLSVFSVKELPEGELVDTTDKKEIEQDEKYNLVQAAKLLAGNKYYMMICVTYILQQIYGAMKLQQLLSQTRKAIDEYQMIEEGDHITFTIS